MPKPLLHITLFLLLFALHLNAFACDTLCVVYNEKNRNFEVDTAKYTYSCHCNQNDLGIYAEYFKKLTIPEEYPLSHVSGRVYLTIKGGEVKILRGIDDQFNLEIMNCYKKNNFIFDSVFFIIRIPDLAYKLSVNNSYFTKEELYKKFGIAKTNKKMVVAVPDENWFSWNQEFIKKANLIDLTQTKDSLFIRLRMGSLRMVGDNMFELRYNSHGWQAREMSYREGAYKCINFGFILFNRYHQFASKKKKETVYMQQRRIIPIDSFGNTDTWDSILAKLNNLKLMQLKTQEDVDYSATGADDGVWFFIEIATPTEYRYLSWSNPEYASPSFDSFAIQELYKLICNSFNSQDYYRFNSANYKMFKYKKNKWSKR